jgi:putative chitinase
MPVLKQGSTGPEVTALQIQLKTLGFDPKGADGNFGPGTKSALIAFQKSKGLQPDGAAGPLTMVALGLSVVGSNTGQPSSDTSSSPTSAVILNAPGLNLAGLAGHLPAAVIAQIPETASKFGITTNLRLAHFLAQCALESNRFKATVENLNYSAPRLLKVFPKYFKGVDPAPYAGNPVKIGNRVYASRMGNGNEASGDGFRFRGRGYIQLTGRNNYTSFSNFIGEDCVANPDLVATTYPLASAAFFFNSNNIWPICDKGANDATVTAVSTRVNGLNPHAVPERIQFFKEYFRALT